MDTQKSVQYYLNKHLREKEDLRATRERSGKYSPSQMGRCFRLQWYNKTNEPKSNPPDDRSLRVLAVGTLFHEFVQNIVKKEMDSQEAFCELEHNLTTENVNGFVDILTEDQVIEVKSQHSKSFWYMAKTNFDVERDKENNVYQAMCYAVLLKKESIRLVYISKDDLCINEYVVPVNDKWRDKIADEILTLQNLKSLPDALPRAFGGMEKKNKEGLYTECAYCDWAHSCAKAGGTAWT